MVLDGVRELVPTVPRGQALIENEISVLQMPKIVHFIMYLQSRVVSQHGRVAEGIREGQLQVQQLVLVQVEGEPDLGVPLVHVVDGVHDATNDEGVRYLVVLQTDVPHVLYF